MPRGRSAIFVALVLVVVASGCSDSNDTPSASSARSQPNGTEGANPSSANQQQTGASAPASESASDRSLAWEDTTKGWLAGWAQSRGIEDPPEVAVIRETRPEEMGELVAECVREQGFDAKAFPDGSWETVGAPGQDDAVALAEYRCIAQYPLQPVFYQPLDDDHLRQSYDWHVETTIPCLQDLGYTTPEPPTVEVYIETYRAQGDQWMAQHAGGLPFEAWDQCPPTPPPEELFPSD